MSDIKREDSIIVIPKSQFLICKIDGLTLKQISKLYSISDLGMKSGCHQLKKFEHHLKIKHDVNLRDYCEKYLNVVWPFCPIKGVKVGYSFCAEGVKIKRFARGGISKKYCENFKVACDKFSMARRGKNNPMYGKIPWNKGLSLADERIEEIAKKRRGRKASEETREKQRKKRAEHPLKARHITKHTSQTIEKLRENTARLWAEGKFNRISSIHKKVRDFLKTLLVKEDFVEEYQVKYFSMDFAFPKSKIAIECQGTYFHVDPRIYPNGPKDAIQRRNYGRDSAKRKVCCDQEGWKIIELWETEINDNSYQEILICKLKEYGLLN